MIVINILVMMVARKNAMDACILSSVNGMGGNKEGLRFS